jgi:hypothetical protein
MKTIKILFILSVFFSSPDLFAQTQKSVDGDWLTANKKSVIRIETDDAGKSHYGKVVWLDKSVDSDKASGALGKVMVKNLAATGGLNKYEGQVFIPRMERFRDAKFELKGDKLLVTMKVGLTSRTVEWTRKSN